jgi:hypothetical protein
MENAALAELAADKGAEFLPLRTIFDDFSFPRLPGPRYLRFLRCAMHAGARAVVEAACD